MWPSCFPSVENTQSAGLSVETTLPFVSYLERDWGWRQLWIQLTRLQIDREEEKKYLSLISVGDACSGKEALRKGAEALNKSNQIMSNTTISADEGHFELAKSICMANNHIHLQLQIIQPFLPDEAGIFLWLVSIPSAAVSRIPASRPSTSWWYSFLPYPTGAACCQMQMAYASWLRTWHWQQEKVTVGCWDREVTRRAGERGRGGCSFFPMGARWDRIHDIHGLYHEPVSSGLCVLLVLVISPPDVRCCEASSRSHRLWRKGEEINNLLALPAWLGLHVYDVLLQTLLMSNVCPHW